MKVPKNQKTKTPPRRKIDMYISSTRSSCYTAATSDWSRARCARNSYRPAPLLYFWMYSPPPLLDEEGLCPLGINTESIKNQPVYISNWNFGGGFERKKERHQSEKKQSEEYSFKRIDPFLLLLFSSVHLENEKKKRGAKEHIE